MSKWIEFVSMGDSPSGKTERFAVLPKAKGVALGEVRWFGRWRCYGFFPAGDTVFERQCLRDIADFCEAQTLAHRKVGVA